MKTLLAHGGEARDALSGTVGTHQYAAHEWVELGIVVVAFVAVMAFIVRERLSASQAASIKKRGPTRRAISRRSATSRSPRSAK